METINLTQEASLMKIINPMKQPSHIEAINNYCAYLLTFDKKGNEKVDEHKGNSLRVFHLPSKKWIKIENKGSNYVSFKINEFGKFEYYYQLPF